ncbi:MAG: alpha/beta fold hydrolase [Flavobacteriaceae bacterium]
MLLHSKILGKGKPLIIIHGYFGMGDNWKTLANKFAANFEVHLIDQRNHGRSFHTDDFTYELMVEDLEYYITHHQLEKPHIIGHSMGGKTAMLFATSFPDTIGKLIVADISPRYYSAHHQVILDALNAVDFSTINKRRDVEVVLSKYIDEVGIRQFLLKNVYWKEKGVLDYRFNLDSLTENVEEVGVALPSFTIFEGDVLFLKGENSGYISTHDASLIEAHFPNAIIKEIKNAGHWLHAENPTDFYTNVMVFLM